MLLRWLRDRAHERARRQEQHILTERAIPDDLWLDTVRRYPFLQWRTVEQLQRLRELTTLFVARKEFTTTQGLALTDEMAVAIGAQACMPIVELGLDWYGSFVGIVVSPDEVVAQRSWMDEDGIVHEGEEILTGEATPDGPILLSWRDVREAGLTAESGYNVVVHEFIHVIDMRDGVPADGCPPLDDARQRTRWESVMAPAFARHGEAVRRAEMEPGDEPWLDPYAAEGPEEFFAVVAEAFFAAPHALRSLEPEVYSLLQDFFRQDPSAFAPG